MVAVSHPRFRSSILERVIASVAARRRSRAARRSVLGLVLLAFVDTLGTLLGAGALVLGGFLVAAWLGFMLTGVALLALDFELSTAVRRRAEQ